jgi:hypothetical protein
MPVDVVQVAIGAVTTAIVTSFSTTTTIALMRYFPKMLDRIEGSIRHKHDDDGKHNKEAE